MPFVSLDTVATFCGGCYGFFCVLVGYSYENQWAVVIGNNRSGDGSILCERSEKAWQ
jgi:hypothetical protein